MATHQRGLTGAPGGGSASLGAQPLVIPAISPWALVLLALLGGLGGWSALRGRR